MDAATRRVVRTRVAHALARASCVNSISTDTTPRPQRHARNWAAHRVKEMDDHCVRGVEIFSQGLVVFAAGGDYSCAGWLCKGVVSGQRTSHQRLANGNARNKAPGRFVDEEGIPSASPGLSSFLNLPSTPHTPKPLSSAIVRLSSSMRLVLLLSLLSLAASFVAFVVSAHSWIECLDTDRSVVFDRAAAFIYGGPRAAGLCQGYQRHYRGRGADVHDEELMVKILKDDYAKPSVPLCKPGNATDATVGFHKRLRVPPNTRVFFAYMPNGHVAVDKAARGTKWGLYWSARPRVELQFTSQLAEDKLLDATRHDFDDGVCGQTYANRTTRERSGRAGDDFPCVGAFRIPEGTAPGVYQIVWMWKFWDEQNDRREIETVGGKYGGAAYSSCFDVEVITTENNTVLDTYAPGTVMPVENGVDVGADSRLER